MTRITINGVSLDPVMQSVALMAAAPEVADATRSNYVLVQTRAPLSDDEKDQLADLGVVIHEYVPDDTYLCGFQPTDLAPIRALPFVTWAGVYLRGFKINPSLRTAPADPSASIVPTGMAHGPSRKPRTVDVVLHDDADSTSTAVLEQLSAATRLDPTALHAGRRKVRLTVEEGQLDRIAALDQVHHIEEIPQRQLFNDRSRQIIHANTVVNSTTYQGAGEVIAVADTGFDRGSTANVHPAFTGRVARLYPLGRPNPVWSDPPGAALQNDLDLIVRAANGAERHGNMGASTRFDRLNNVEQVVWTTVPPGKADIIIRAFRITRFPQPYAYVWRLI